MTEDTHMVIGLIGAMTQLGSIVLIVLLLYSLLPTQRALPSFRRWRIAWVAFLIGIAAVVLRYSGLPELADFAHRTESDTMVRALYFAYFAGKLFFFVFLILGVRQFHRENAAEPPMWVIVGAGLGVTTVVTLLSPTLNQTMVVQSTMAVPVLAWCMWVLARRESVRRSRGTTLLAVAFGAHTVLWAAYAVGFWGQSLGIALWPGFQLLLTYNSFIDAVVQTLMAYGMVVVLLEYASHESQFAHRQLEVAHDALRRAMLFDPLTGAMSRHAFAEGTGLTALDGSPGAVVIIDVDHLKPINDSLGHAAGDALLRHVATTLSRALRAEDALYRWGGDEFLVLLPGATEEIARRLVGDALEEASSVPISGILVPVRVSYGASTCSSRDDLEDAIWRADRSMYEAKDRRRGPKVAAEEAAVAL